MTKSHFFATVSCLVGTLAFGTDMQATKPTKAASGAERTLSVISELTIKSESAGPLIDPIQCDRDGNVYLMTSIDPSDGIRKLNSKGELLARFRASSASSLPVQVAVYYSVGLDGEVFQVAIPQHTIKRAVLIYAKDGNYKSGVTLENPPGAADWLPSQVAAFQSGDLLVTGLILDSVKHISTPFTGIFSSNGQLQRQVLLADDEEIQKLVENGDPHVVATDRPYSNRAVEWGQMDAASDGNIYLLRNMSPAIIYAISPAGEVVKRFTVETTGNVISMHLANQKIAVLYKDGDAPTDAVRIVGFDGHVIATYHQKMKDGHGELGTGLACYAENPERFIFLSTTDEGFLQFKVAEPQ